MIYFRHVPVSTQAVNQSFIGGTKYLYLNVLFILNVYYHSGISQFREHTKDPKFKQRPSSDISKFNPIQRENDAFIYIFNCTRRADLLYFSNRLTMCFE